MTSPLIKPLSLLRASAVALLLLPSLAAAKPQYGYKGDVAPEKWGELSPKYAACADGAEQAPLNIVTSATVKKSESKPLKPEYGPTSGDLVVNTGTTIQVNSSGNLKIGNSNYKLLQYHFHTPSEEAINGVHYDMNVHIVHQGADGKLAVIGVNFKKGAANAFLGSFWDKLPTTKGGKLELNLPSLSGLLPDSLSYFTYPGSLTTPPCTEGVQFYILKQPISISTEQLEAFRRLHPMNARPLQPIRERVIKTGG